MATRTFIDGGKQAITFNNDTEPVAVYVDGELQQNVSFVPQLAQGTGTVSYDSEYKKNHIDIEMQGTTSQKQYQGYQQVGFKDFTNSYTDTDGNVLNVECKDGIITLNGKTNKLVSFTLNYLNMTNRVLKAGTYTFASSWVREAGTNGVFGNTGGCDCRFDVASGSPIYSYFGQRTVITFETDVTVGYFQPYINFSNGQEFINAKFAIGVFKGDVPTADFPPYEPYVGGIPSPNPQYPQEIENANNEGMNVTLHGDNLLNKEKFLLGALKNETEFSIYGANVLSNTNVNAMLKPNTKYTLSYEVEGVVGMPDGATVVKGQGFSFVNNANQSQYFATMGRKIANEGETYTYSTTFTTPSTLYGDLYSLYLYSGRYSLNGVNTLATCIIRNVQIVEGAEAKPFQPYFREEISIPTSVEVDNGDGTTKTVDLPFTIYDKLIVNRVANTVTYAKKSGIKVFTGTEGFSAGTSNDNDLYNYKIELYRIGFNQTTSNGYCSHFTPVTLADYSEKYDVCFDVTDAFGDTNIYFLYDKLDNNVTTAKNMFKSWVAEQYNAGTPLTIVAEYEEVEPIDITQSSLAQSLLNLATQNQTNYFEISSNEKAPQVPIKINYAKWGELVENNNNT